MSLSHAVLTSLIEKASSGYDLARRFDKSIGYFWHATHQQIYRELARMEAAGWIVSQPAPDAGMTRKRLYEVLPAGREELARWAAEPTPPPDLRDDLSVKLRAEAALGEIDLRAELRQRHQDRKSGVEGKSADPGGRRTPKNTLSRAAAIQHMILQKGLRYEEGNLRWCEEMLALLDMPLSASTAAPPAT